MKQTKILAILLALALLLTGCAQLVDLTQRLAENRDEQLEQLARQGKTRGALLPDDLYQAGYGGFPGSGGGELPAGSDQRGRGPDFGADHPAVRGLRPVFTPCCPWRTFTIAKICRMPRPRRSMNFAPASPARWSRLWRHTTRPWPRDRRWRSWRSTLGRAFSMATPERASGMRPSWTCGTRSRRLWHGIMKL